MSNKKAGPVLRRDRPTSRIRPSGRNDESEAMSLLEKGNIAAARPAVKRALRKRGTNPILRTIMKKQIHVVQRDDGWAPLRAGASKSGPVQKTQAQAIQAATATAKREGGEVVIHGRDGQIRERNSYGNDPYPPPG